MAACKVLQEPLALTLFHGQMPIADYWTDGTDTLLTKYGVGARGIDVITKVANGGSETFGYPLYDTHGNMVATLARNGSSFTLGNQQSYDVWGSVRSGSSSEEQGYVANLGHRADPESFLTYMRARYYEPMSGRFISEDRVRDGQNWLAYCGNDPINFSDNSGNSRILEFLGLLPLLLNLGTYVAEKMGVNKEWLALINILSSFIDYVMYNIALIQVAAAVDRHGTVAVSAFRAVQLLKALAVLTAVVNMRWYILLQDDPDVPSSEAWEEMFN